MRMMFYLWPPCADSRIFSTTSHVFPTFFSHKTFGKQSALCDPCQWLGEDTVRTPLSSGTSISETGKEYSEYPTEWVVGDLWSQFMHHHIELIKARMFAFVTSTMDCILVSPIASPWSTINNRISSIASPMATDDCSIIGSFMYEYYQLWCCW